MIALVLTVTCGLVISASAEEGGSVFSLSYDNGVWEIYRRNTVVTGGLTEESTCTSYLYIGDTTASRLYCHCTSAASAQNSSNNIATVSYTLKYVGDNGNSTITTSPGSFAQVTTHAYNCSIPKFSTIVGVFSRSGASGVMYDYSGTIVKAY